MEDIEFNMKFDYENSLSGKGEETKIVSSKISRSEFANFMKICESENGKSVNKKIRELINQEIAENFARPIKMNGKRKKFFVPSENKFIELVEVEDD